MDYEKAYKDAVSKIKSIIADKKKQGLTNCLFEGDLNRIFPELAENEDERTRKELIDLIKDIKGQARHVECYDRYLAWLEKQGEQKPKFRVGDTIKCKYDDRRFTIKSVDLDKGTYTYTQEDCGNYIDYADEEFELVEQKSDDKIEPKFKVSDWILIDNPCQIESIDNNGNYTVRYCDAEETHLLSRNFCDSHFHLWTIQDAKDGDVLEFDFGIGIFKEHADNYNAYCYCYYNNEDGLVVSNDELLDEYQATPATKEQRDLLFLKMKEAGYEWDTEKKELKKIEQIDEKHKVGEYFTGLIPCWINAPSTQQPAHNYHGKNVVAIHLKDGGYRCCCIDDKKPVTFTLPENTQLVEGWKRKSTVWSEEDEKMMKQIDSLLYCQCTIHSSMYEKLHNWLKSLKPQPRWKPTEEQLMALRDAIDNNEMESLYNDLKKL